MTNEIKEILDELESMFEISELEEQVNNINKIKNSITNLQEENKQLKRAIKEKVIATCNTCEWFGVCPHSYKEYDYKTQIDKAIEYIKEHTIHDTPKRLKNGIYEQGQLIRTCDFYIEDLLDILQGDE